MTGDDQRFAQLEARAAAAEARASAAEAKAADAQRSVNSFQIVGLPGSGPREMYIPDEMLQGGRAGPAGNDGEQGPQGDQGPQGPSDGPQGPQGFQGEQGNLGGLGPQGFQGDQGPQGPQGFQGEKGDQGNQGEKGEQGNQGNAGTQGPQGDQGPAGKESIVTTTHGIYGFACVEATKILFMDIIPAGTGLRPKFDAAIAGELTRFRSLDGAVDLVLGVRKGCEGWDMPPRTERQRRQHIEFWSQEYDRS